LCVALFVSDSQPGIRPNLAIQFQAPRRVAWIPTLSPIWSVSICSRFDRIGQRAVVRDYFSVQVKSDLGPWFFEGQEEVRWLVEYPSPQFLACVNKKKGSVAVYQLMPRFARWALGSSSLPDRLELKPSDKDYTESVGWIDGAEFTLQAPIIKVTLADFIDEEKMRALREVFEFWVVADGENCDMVRRGLAGSLPFPDMRLPPVARSAANQKSS
jgi:hypothetical protein